MYIGAEAIMFANLSIILYSNSHNFARYAHTLILPIILKIMSDSTCIVTVVYYLLTLNVQQKQ